MRTLLRLFALLNWLRATLSMCQAVYTDGIATTPLNVCQDNSGSVSTIYTCKNGAGYYDTYFLNNQCSGSPISTSLASSTPNSIAQCTGPICDYVVIRFYTSNDCSASSGYGDYAIVTNQCNVDTSRGDYKSWINICDDNSYGAINYVDSDCTGDIYNQPVAWRDGYCDPQTNGRIDIVGCSNPITRFPTNGNTPQPTIATTGMTTTATINDLTTSKIQTTPSPVSDSNMDSTQHPSFEPTVEPTFEPTIEPTGTQISNTVSTNTVVPTSSTLGTRNKLGSSTTKSDSTSIGETSSTSRATDISTSSNMSNSPAQLSRFSSQIIVAAIFVVLCLN